MPYFILGDASAIAGQLPLVSPTTRRILRGEQPIANVDHRIGRKGDRFFMLCVPQGQDGELRLRCVTRGGKLAMLVTPSSVRLLAHLERIDIVIDERLLFHGVVGTQEGHGQTCVVDVNCHIGIAQVGRFGLAALHNLQQFGVFFGIVLIEQGNTGQARFAQLAVSLGFQERNCLVEHGTYGRMTRCESFVGCGATRRL
jgi:hypothetical protein